MPSKNSNTVITKNRTNVATKTQVNTTNVKKVPKEIALKSSTSTAVNSNVFKKPVTQIGTNKNVNKSITATHINTNRNQSKSVTATRTKPVPLKATVPISKSNVMNKIHNVTILSPPPIRKNDDFVDHVTPDDSLELGRERTRTRTLEPHEVVVLNKQHLKQNINPEPSSSREMSLDSVEQNSIQYQKVKDPITFEINFEKPKIKSEKQILVNNEPEDEYEDDFESYESDFESGSSSQNSSELDTPTPSQTPTQISDTEGNISDDPDEIPQSSRALITTDISRDEHKFDSGTYDLQNGLAREKRENPMNSIEEDSGIDNIRSKTSSLYSTPPPIEPPAVELSKKLTAFDIRGQDLMKKIFLDTMNFHLLELKPMTYEFYMKIYGNMDSIQNSTQTNEDVIEQEVQTDDYYSQSIWTQYPPRFSSINAEHLYSKQFYEEKNGVGIGDKTDEKSNNDGLIYFKNIRSKSIINVKSSNLLDYDQLNIKLKRFSLTIFEILDQKRTRNKHLHKSHLKISNGYNPVQIKENIITYNIYTNLQVPHLFVTIHDSESPEFSQIASVWSVSDSSKPLHILSTWSRISCIEIHPALTNIVIAGLCDGSVAAWDLRENSYWHSYDSQDEISRVPSQIVVPEFMLNCDKIEDFGRVAAIKGVVLQKNYGLLKQYNPIQVRLSFISFVIIEYCCFDTLTKI